MGGDLGPAEMVEAVKLALAEFPGLNPINLVGDEAILQPLLRSAKLDRHPLLTVTHASEVITPEDEVMQAIKRKRDASMLRAIDLVKSGEAGAVVSTGNTKILVAAGTLKLRTLDGVERPALAPIVPREGGHFILIDGGANPEAKAQHLVHNAILGTHYCRVVLGIEKPRVGLLTIGTEENKGNALISETHDALKKLNGLINYAGPVEGFHVFLDEVDVVVCDGFVGNICLKSWESMSKFFSRTLKTNLRPTRCACSAHSSRKVRSRSSNSASNPSATAEPRSSAFEATFSKHTAPPTGRQSKTPSVMPMSAYASISITVSKSM